MMRADNRGEGGILALTVLALRAAAAQACRWIMAAGLIGAALFYGDGVITPAISVLSAVEGLKVATPALEPYVVPLTLLLLVALFIVQRRGTGLVGGYFGPIMILWFVVIGILGGVGDRAPPVDPVGAQPALRRSTCCCAIPGTASCCSARSCWR